jgi:hypothetical protein
MLTHFLLLPGFYFVFNEVDRLSVVAEPAVAVLGFQEAEDNLVRLPEIEFRLSLSPDCAGSGRPEALSVAIADTRKTLGGEALQGSKTVDIVLRVPAGQLAPLALAGFCVGPESEGESVLIASALAAQASLRCSHDENQSIVFAAAPLDIRIDCIPSAGAPMEPIDD